MTGTISPEASSRKRWCQSTIKAAERLPVQQASRQAIKSKYNPDIFIVLNIKLLIAAIQTCAYRSENWYLPTKKLVRTDSQIGTNQFCSW